MEHEFFWLDGIRCDTVGLRLQGPVTFESASPRVSSITVPGRNGDLHYNEGAYSNVAGEARCFSLKKQFVDRALSAIAKWSLLELGYHRLETTEEPEYFRLASIAKGPETEIRMRVLAPFSIQFDCMPQKFLKSGEREIKLEKSGVIIRNNWFPALPKITVNGSGAGTLSIGGKSITFRDSFRGPLIYDSDTQDAYYNRQNKNGEIYAPEPLVIQNGDITVAWNGGITSVNIIPRWWTL